jgi:hypothetical protein
VSAATFANTKSPEALVTTGMEVVPRVSLMSVTVAPGITPPCASFTVPAIVPVVICAAAGDASASSRMKAAAAVFGLMLAMMRPPDGDTTK